MNTNNETVFAKFNQAVVGFGNVNMAGVFGIPEEMAASAVKEKISSLKKKPSKKNMKALHKAVEILCRFAKDRGDHLELIEEARTAISEAVSIREKEEVASSSQCQDKLKEVFGIGKKTTEKKDKKAKATEGKVDVIQPKAGIVLTNYEEEIITRIRAGEIFNFGPKVDENAAEFMKARHEALSYLGSLAKTGEEIDPFKVSVGVERYAKMIKDEIADMGDEWEFASSALGIAVTLSHITDLDEVPEGAQKIVNDLVQLIDGLRNQHLAAMVLKYQNAAEAPVSQETPARKPARRK